jgi:hypothetical protein
MHEYVNAASVALLDGCLQASFHELVPSLLALAESWARAREATLTGAAAQLYVDLFVGSGGSLERQQVLQALHGHLGSGVAGEQDAALQVGWTVDILLYRLYTV